MYLVADYERGVDSLRVASGCKKKSQARACVQDATTASYPNGYLSPRLGHEDAELEVMNMLITEWKMEDALAVRYEEGMEDGKEDIARNALAKGIPVELIHDITGLDMDTIKNLST